MQTTRGFKLPLVLATLGSVILFVAVAFPAREYLRIASPDGRYYAVASYPFWRAFVPAMAGQSGDKPGFVTIYNFQGQSCGRAPVPMVSFIHDLRWSGDEARIPALAEWNLPKRRVTTVLPAT